MDTTGKPTMAETRCVNLFDFAMTIDAVLEVLDHAPGTIHGLVEDYLSDAAEAAQYESWG